MTRIPGERIREIFHAARERDRSEREAFLEDACAGDEALKKEVAALLDAHRDAPDFPDRPAWAQFVDGTGERRPETDELEPEPDLPFDRLGEFRLITRLGEGGMGVVYLAVQESLNRKVALKVIRPERVGSFEAEARFEREVDAIAELQHPNIVTVYESGEEKGVRFFAMEYAEGRGLERVLRDGGPFQDEAALTRVVGWIRDVANALQTAHGAGIIHRDVKPSNIRITPDERAMLLDFGVARHLDLASLTLSGQFRGTPNYASPEQVSARRREIDARSDIYSLGVTLYEMITGTVPFVGETTEQVFHQILEREPLPPRRLNPAISRDLDTVVLKAMEKDATRRYQTMAAFSDDLGRALAGEPIEAKAAGWFTKSAKWVRRHRQISIAAIGLLAAAAAVTVLLLFMAAKHREEIRSARERFKPIREAFGWMINDARVQAVRWGWCLDIDRPDPFGSMVEAVLALDRHELNHAADYLEMCLVKCRARKVGVLAQEAHYLLALIKTVLAGERSDLEERAALLDESAAHGRSAGAFDPTSPETLVWRRADTLPATPAAAQAVISGLNMNAEHAVFHYYFGLVGFHDLYKGGEVHEFVQTISHFEAFLESRPRNLTMLTCLGRTCYFFARFYDFLDMAEKGRRALDRALDAGGETPPALIHNTLGAVCLLLGLNNEALEHNRMAYEGVKEFENLRPNLNIHNIYAGIGKSLARLGRLEEARANYEKGLALTYNDPHLCVAMAEIYLKERNPAEALRTMDMTEARLTYSKSSYALASAFLVRCRAHLMTGEIRKADAELQRLFDLATFSLRDFGLAAFVATTFPEEFQRAGNDDEVGLVVTGARLSGQALKRGGSEERRSPMYYSMEGLHFYFRGELKAESMTKHWFTEAIPSFEKAIEERKKWPESARSFRWDDDGRDRFFLAICHAKLADETDAGREHQRLSNALFEEAERACREKEPPIETADIIERVRQKAKELLGKE